MKKLKHKIIYTRIIILVLFVAFTQSVFSQVNQSKIYQLILKLDKERVLKDADKYLKENPITITDFIAKRSAGGIHDYYSEGDYWWPNPQNPDGPYIRKDGLTNPNNFTAHRKAMRRLSIQVATLVAAYKMTGNIKYAKKAIEHLHAWFINKKTLMNPNLKYAQAIKGIVTGRGIGIIDTIHLVEVVQAIIELERAGVIKPDDLSKLKNWFGQYNNWMFTSKFGIHERDNGNNHSTCWCMQVAEYAKFTNDTTKLNYCRKFFKDELLPNQMSANGSFPLELKRTKPYGYSLFNLDAMVMVAEILSTPNDNLFDFTTQDGKNLKTAIEFMYPYIKEKSSWPYQKDVMYFNDWPVRQPSLLFGGMAYNEIKYINLWKTLNPSPSKAEILRNFFIRQPILWVSKTN